MSENENKLSVRINKKIGIPEWERFEQLADEKKRTLENILGYK